ncbi:hypothetical protein BSKO_02008 [Bryopsis sp. KO-2023]|nr:hypothetical protein BSKO_02008 [Bryopsis sp. KO-2023]
MSVESQQTGEGDIEENDNGSLVPSNSSASDRDLWKFFAQRAPEPDVKERRAKGAFVFQKRGFEEGRHFYEEEEKERLKRMESDRGSEKLSGSEDFEEEKNDTSERSNRKMGSNSGRSQSNESPKGAGDEREKGGSAGGGRYKKDKHEPTAGKDEDVRERPKTAEAVHRGSSLTRTMSVSDVDTKGKQRQQDDWPMEAEPKSRREKERKSRQPSNSDNEHAVSKDDDHDQRRKESPDPSMRNRREQPNSRGKKQSSDLENVQSGSDASQSRGKLYDDDDGSGNTVSKRINHHLRRESSDMHKGRYHEHSDASTQHQGRSKPGGKSTKNSMPPMPDSGSDTSGQESRRNRRKSTTKRRSRGRGESEFSPRSQSMSDSHDRRRSRQHRSESRRSRRKIVEYYSPEEEEEARTRRRASSRRRSSAGHDSDESSRSRRRRSSRRKRRDTRNSSGSESSDRSEQPRRRDHRSESRRRQENTRFRGSESPTSRREGKDRAHKKGDKHRSRADKDGNDDKSKYAGDVKSMDQMDSRPKERKQRTRWQTSPDREYVDDLSEWGKSEIPDFYDSERATSTNTMSSGLSPRDSKPAALEWDPENARRTLAYNAGLYGAAQTMRRQGQVAGGPLALTEDLPSRLAYQHLNALAGMAGKVQDAILHNKKIFEQRLLLADMALKQRGLDAWRTYRNNRKTKEQVLQRAVARIRRGLLARAYFTWKDKFHLVDKDLQMRRKVNATINRGIVKRCFQEWQEICKEHAWKCQIRMREREVKALEGKIRGYERRPIVVLKYRKMKECFRAWLMQSDRLRRKKLIQEKAGRHFKNAQYLKAWNSWCVVAEEEKRRSNLIKKAAGRIQNVKAASAMTAWKFMVEMNKEKKGKIEKALDWWKNALMARAWRPLVEHAKWKKEKRQICNRWKQPFMAKAFYGWIDRIEWRKRMVVITTRTTKRLLFRSQTSAFQAWTEAVQEARLEREFQSKEEVVAHNQELHRENDRLRRDNERFVRLIDSGEWGRGRVSELSQAGEILRSERDALMELVKSLRREYEAVERAKHAQEGELRSLKEKLVLGGASTAAGRNKMLVRGASSFNALVRAMKQDLIEKGTGKADPKLMYEVERMSLDKVHVFPDGELKVQAVTSGNNPASLDNVPNRPRNWDARSRRNGRREMSISELGEEPDETGEH